MTAPLPAHVHDIAGQLVPLAVPVGWLDPLGVNPRRGDIEAIAASYERFGQRKPIVAKVTKATKKGEARGGEVLAGNHQLLAAISLGWTHIAVVWVTDDEEGAKAFALADNRTHDLGYYDDEVLAELMSEVNLQGTGYTDRDLDDVLSRIDLPSVVSIPGQASVEGGQASDSVVLQWGFIQWGTKRVQISPREVYALDCLFGNYVEEQGIASGFGYHLVDERVTDETVEAAGKRGPVTINSKEA
jgi:hypothetical protein